MNRPDRSTVRTSDEGMTVVGASGGNQGVVGLTRRRGGPGIQQVGSRIHESGYKTTFTSDRPATMKTLVRMKKATIQGIVKPRTPSARAG